MSPTRRQLAILFALLILLAVSAAPALLLSGPQEDYGGRASEWRLHGLVGLDPARHALLVVAPRAAFSDADVSALFAFVQEGGRALVAADTGAGIELVARLDVGVALTDVRVYSPDFAEDPRRIVATSTGAIAGLPDEVALDRPVLVTGGSAVLLPPDLSWEDRNGNGLPDLEEPLATGSFAALAPLAQGALLVVGDPRAVASGAPTQAPLLDWLTEEGARALVVDASHGALSDPLGIGAAAAWDLPLAASIGILMVAAGIGAFVVLAPRLRRREAPRGARVQGARVPPDLLARILGELDP